MTACPAEPLGACSQWWVTFTGKQGSVYTILDSFQTCSLRYSLLELNIMSDLGMICGMQVWRFNEEVTCPKKQVSCVVFSFFLCDPSENNGKSRYRTIERSKDSIHFILWKQVQVHLGSQRGRDMKSSNNNQDLHTLEFRSKYRMSCSSLQTSEPWNRTQWPSVPELYYNTHTY